MMHYTTALNALKKENDTNYWFEIFYAWTLIVMLQSAKTTLLGGDKIRYFFDRLHTFEDKIFCIKLTNFA